MRQSHQDLKLLCQIKHVRYCFAAWWPTSQGYSEEKKRIFCPCITGDEISRFPLTTNRVGCAGGTSAIPEGRRDPKTSATTTRGLLEQQPGSGRRKQHKRRRWVCAPRSRARRACVGDTGSGWKCRSGFARPRQKEVSDRVILILPLSCFCLLLSVFCFLLLGGWGGRTPG